MPPAARVSPLAAAAAPTASGPVAAALRAELDKDRADALAGFYGARGYRPLWLHEDESGAVEEVLRALRDARRDGLDPAAYDPVSLAASVERAHGGRPQDIARAELALSRAVGAWIADLHRPAPGAEMTYADPAVAPPSYAPDQVLRQIAEAPSPAAGLQRLRRMNPLYQDLRTRLAEAEARGDRPTVRLLQANLERARALPADLGPRYVLVDAAAQELQVWDGGRLVETMPVVVGKPSQPTPMLAGVIRFAVLAPYWHMPPDLAAERVAPAVLREGPQVLDRQDLELVSDFSETAAPLDPAQVDWAEVAAGREIVHLRQRPGPDNMMGQVKFIFPNSLGVYLHDTPLKGLFGAARRAESAGCVRLSDAPALARLLLGRDANLGGSGAPEERVDLPRPAPVYLVYFTVRPTASGLARRPDIYGRDAPVVAALSRMTRSGVS